MKKIIIVLRSDVQNKFNVFECDEKQWKESIEIKTFYIDKNAMFGNDHSPYRDFIYLLHANNMNKTISIPFIRWRLIRSQNNEDNALI